MGHMEKRVVPAVVAMAAAAVMMLSPANANAQQAAAPQAQTETTGSKFGNFIRKAAKQAGAAIEQTGNGAQAAVDGVNAAHSAVNGNGVRGRMQQADGSTVTCFNGIEACYVGPGNMASPGQATKTPLMIVTRDGRVLPNNADRLVEAGVIVLPPAGGAGSGGARAGQPDTGYRDSYGTGCVTPGMTGDEIARNRVAIHECQMEQVGERAWQRSQARIAQERANAGGGSPAANGRTAAPSNEEQVARIQRDATASFASILQQANVAAPKPK